MRDSRTPDTTITISFMGGSLVPGLPKTLTLDQREPVTVNALLERLERVLGIPDLRAQVTHHFIVVLNDTAIQHLQGWDTLIPPGARLTILAPMGGGSFGNGWLRRGSA